VRAAFWELRWAINEQSGQLAGEALGKDPKVKAALERFTALAPFDGFLWYDLGALYVNLRYPRDAAKRAFENARDARPEWAYPYFGLAIIETEQSYALKNKTELRAGLQSAGAKFEEAIKRDGDFVLAYIIGALCYADAAQTPKAIILAQQAASKAPNSGLAKYALGYAYFGSGRKQYPNARAFLQEALSAKSDPLDAGQVNHAQEILKEIGRKH
jgi:tetratricopeptide (TPR) repeat protein